MVPPGEIETGGDVRGGDVGRQSVLDVQTESDTDTLPVHRSAVLRTAVHLLVHPGQGLLHRPAEPRRELHGRQQATAEVPVVSERR